MYFLEMKVGRLWLEVGSFASVQEAKDCMFDARYDYRVTDEAGIIEFVQYKQAANRRAFV